MLQLRRQDKEWSRCWSWQSSLVCVSIAVMSLLGVLTYVHLYYQRDDQMVHDGKCHQNSPSYPSAGGPGCSPKCVSNNLNSINSSYGAGIYNSTQKWPNELIRNMHKAASIVKKHGSVNNLDIERSIYLHITFDYFCCYSREEGSRIGKFLQSYTMIPLSVYFDRMVCVVYGFGDMVAIVLRLDEKSQANLLDCVLQFEHDMEVETGIPKHIPHTLLQEFHMTLGTVNQSVFPVQAALEEINRVIPPGAWHSEPIMLHTPLCNNCPKVIAETKRLKHRS